MVINFLRSIPGRMLKVGFGLALFTEGTALATLEGLVMMMAGVVLVVTGVAGVSLVEEGVNIWKEHAAAAPRSRERRV